MDVQIDLSTTAIRGLARGNPDNLPTFMVHDDAVWPWGKVQIDNKKRIHVRRSTLNNTIAPALPMRPGLWMGVDVQQFHIDLSAAQLDGDGSKDRLGQDSYREIATDKRLCPECGSWMLQLPEITERPIRMCSAGSCGWTEGLETTAQQPKERAAIDV